MESSHNQLFKPLIDFITCFQFLILVLRITLFPSTFSIMLFLLDFKPPFQLVSSDLVNYKRMIVQCRWAWMSTFQREELID